MKRTVASSKLHRETAKLVRFALALHASGSQIESQNWQQQLSTVIAQLFHKKQNEILEQALDYLWLENPPACDVLAELIEGHAESLTEDEQTNAVLIAIPLLAWSRYAISAGRLNKHRLRELRVRMKSDLLASDVRLALADVLYSPDQLPRGFIETRSLLQKLARSAMDEEDLYLDSAELVAAGEFVADVRYIFAAVVVDKGAPIFRWQQAEMTQQEVLQTWQSNTKSIFTAILPGCHFNTLLPNAFFSAWRKLEQEARVFSLRAAVSYLCEMLNLKPQDLRAVLAPFYDQTLEEYRIGFSLLGTSPILHGVVWPLIGEETEETDIVAQIERELTDLGKVVVLRTSMPMEYCDDCGTPLFPNAEGEMVHPEMPETEDTAPQLH
ncbi:MAG: DUF2863 family protein [Sulfuriferula sp.]